jgi:hypothetical protein
MDLFDMQVSSDLFDWFHIYSEFPTFSLAPSFYFRRVRMIFFLRPGVQKIYFIRITQAQRLGLLDTQKRRVHKKSRPREARVNRGHTWIVFAL